MSQRKESHLNARKLYLCCLVVVNFKATGSAPILKQSKFKVSSKNTFESIILFLKKQLHYESKEVQLVGSFN